MLFVFVTWPAWELEITKWLILVSGLDPHVAPLLLGNMDTKAKLDRIKAIYKQMGAEPVVQYVGRLSKRHEHHVQCRNIMTHNSYGGYLVDEPDVTLFRTHRAAPGHFRLGTYAYQIHLDQMTDAAEFAKGYAETMGDWLEGLHGRREREFRRGPLPTRPRKSRNTLLEQLRLFPD